MPTTVTVNTSDGEMGLYDAEPEGSARSAVMVIQEAFGVNDHIEDVTRRFASEGYRAVAPHLFHRSGDPVLGYGELQKVMPHMQAVTEAGLVEDLDATLAYLSGAGFASERVGVVGFCMGGPSASWLRCTTRWGRPSPSTGVGSPAAGSAPRPRSTWPHSCRLRGSDCTATGTRASRLTTLRPCARRHGRLRLD